MSERKSRTDSTANLMSIGAAVRQVQATHPTVTASSLRFLEREGLIAPTRTPGGHRLYSSDDVERILQIKSWQDERLTLEQIRARLAERDRLPNPDDLADEVLRLILSEQLREARQRIRHADALGMPLGTIFGEVLQPVLYEVGRRWEHGTMLVAQEKETSELIRDLIAELSQRHDTPVSGDRVIVAGCVAGERHELGIRMIAGVLRSEGYRVHYLGADVAHEFFEQAVRLHQPDAVLLSVKLQQNLEHLPGAAEQIRQATSRDLVILVGGEIVPGEAERIRAWGLIPITATTFDGVVSTIGNALGTSTTEQEIA